MTATENPTDDQLNAELEQHGKWIRNHRGGGDGSIRALIAADEDEAYEDDGFMTAMKPGSKANPYPIGSLKPSILNDPTRMGAAGACGSALSARCFNGDDGCTTHPNRPADENPVRAMLAEVLPALPADRIELLKALAELGAYYIANPDLPCPRHVTASSPFLSAEEFGTLAEARGWDPISVKHGCHQHHVQRPPLGQTGLWVTASVHREKDGDAL